MVGKVEKIVFVRQEDECDQMNTEIGWAGLLPVLDHRHPA